MTALANPLDDLVADRPLTELPSAKARCPFCASLKLRPGHRYSTLVGGGSGVDNDPNHVHQFYTCLECSRPFCRETREGKTWYTYEDEKRRAVLVKGRPHCFESYVYSCGHCGAAEVTRRYTKLDGVTPARSLCTRLVDGQSIDEFRTFFTCKSCNREVEADNRSY